MLEGRRDQFEAELRSSRGRHAPPGRARTSTPPIDRLVWYAGWADKIAQVTGSANPSPDRTSTTRPPSPPASSPSSRRRAPLLGLVCVVAPVIATGNTVVVVASEPHPLTAITLAEVMATSDVPGGVVNVLTGSAAEIAPWLASHMDVNGLDLTGVADPELARVLEVAAAENLKRVRRPAEEDLLADAGSTG